MKIQQFAKFRNIIYSKKKITIVFVVFFLSVFISFFLGHCGFCNTASHAGHGKRLSVPGRSGKHHDHL